MTPRIVSALILLLACASIPAPFAQQGAIAAPPAVAKVLGEVVRTRDPAEVQDAILTALLDRYAAQHRIAVTDAELDSYLSAMTRYMPPEEELSPAEAAEVDALRRQMGTAVIRQWKINKSLYETYGGRVIYQQFGPEPLDAYLKFLRESEAAGDFRITDQAMEKAFWSYFTDEARHDFMVPGSEDLEQAFTVAPWESMR